MKSDGHNKNLSDADVDRIFEEIRNYRSKPKFQVTPRGGIYVDPFDILMEEADELDRQCGTDGRRAIYRWTGKEL
jgi:hypothetical protein